jgi:hypothetical protein
MGDFEAVYTDPAGIDHSLEFNECVQTGYLGDTIHPGRSAPEGCEIATDERAGIYFTGAIHTFSLPIDDSKAGFAVGVFELEGGGVGAPDCGDLRISSGEQGVSECSLPNETKGGEAWDYSDLEQAFCEGVSRLNSYCGDHLDDEDPPCVEPSAATDPNR